MSESFIQKLESSALAKELENEVNITNTESTIRKEALLCLHGLDFLKLKSAARYGALIDPSIAITTNESSYDKYGEILVVLKPSVLFDGKQSINKRDNSSLIYTGDFYSARVPYEYVNLDRSGFNQFINDVVGDLDNRSAHESRMRSSVYTRRAYEIFGVLTDNPEMKRRFMQEQGVTYSTPMMRKPLPSDSLALEAETAFGRNNMASLHDHLDEFTEFYKKLMTEKLSPKYGKDGVPKLLLNRINNRPPESMMAILLKTQGEHKSVRSKEMIVDKKALESRIARAFKKAGGRGELYTWAHEKIDSLTKSRHYEVDGKRLPDIDAASRYVKANKGVSKEKTLGFAVGELKSMGLSRMLSFSDIISNKDLISKEFDKDENLYQALNRFLYLLPTDDNEIDKECAKQVCLNGVSEPCKLAKILGAELAKENAIEIEKQCITLKNAYDSRCRKVTYFEAKEHRDIKLDSSNIECIVVSNEMKKSVEELLVGYGVHLKVKGYNPDVEGAQMSKIPVSANILAKKIPQKKLGL